MVSKSILLLALAPLSSDGFSVPCRSSVTTVPSKRSLIGLRMSADTKEEAKDGKPLFSDDVLDEASDALTAVGWSAPSDDAELTANDPFVQSIDESIQRDFGVSLDDLLNPAKVRRLGGLCC